MDIEEFKKAFEFWIVEENEDGSMDFDNSDRITEFRGELDTKEKRVLDSAEAAQYLGISYWLIRKLVREKKIPYYKIESKTLFTKEILDKYIEDSLEEAKPKTEEKKVYSFKDF